MARSKLVDLEVTFKHETDNAVLINAGGEDVWVPKSMCETTPDNLTNTQRGDTIEITMNESFAMEKGLI